MQSLDGQHLVWAWEVGRSQHPVERALTLLAAGLPDTDRASLADWPLGRRDAALLALREATVGPALDVHTHCPACRAELEFSLDSPSISGDLPDRLAEGRDPGASAPMLDIDDGAGAPWRFRPPTSTDLLAAARADSVEDAREVLTRRCLVSAPVPDGEPPEEVLAALPARLAEADPGAELVVDLICPDCGHGWRADLDVATFFWTEVDSEARRLLRDVHALARAYGWREADILAMSPARRQVYLEMVLG